MKAIFYSLLLTGLLFTACGDDDDGPGGGNCNEVFTVQFEQEINDITAAATAYAMNPTPENCQAYKDAYNDYIDSLEDWADCADELGQSTEWQQSLDDARDAIDALIC